MGESHVRGGDMIGYDWLSLAVIGSCDKSCLVFMRVPHSRISLNEQYNAVNGKIN